MSGAQAIMAAKKRGYYSSFKQISIDFFSRSGTGCKFISTSQATIECNYCDKCFKSPRGLSSHLKAHYLAMDRVKKRPKYGKVKLRDLDSSIPSTNTGDSTQQEYNGEGDSNPSKETGIGIGRVEVDGYDEFGVNDMRR